MEVEFNASFISLFYKNIPYFYIDSQSFWNTIFKNFSPRDAWRRRKWRSHFLDWGEASHGHARAACKSPRLWRGRWLSEHVVPGGWGWGGAGGKEKEGNFTFLLLLSFHTIYTIVSLLRDFLFYRKLRVLINFFISSTHTSLLGHRISTPIGYTTLQVPYNPLPISFSMIYFRDLSRETHTMDLITHERILVMSISRIEQLTLGRSRKISITHSQLNTLSNTTPPRTTYSAGSRRPSRELKDIRDYERVGTNSGHPKFSNFQNGKMSKTYPIRLGKHHTLCHLCFSLTTLPALFLSFEHLFLMFTSNRRGRLDLLTLIHPYLTHIVDFRLPLFLHFFCSDVSSFRFATLFRETPPQDVARAPFTRARDGFELTLPTTSDISVPFVEFTIHGPKQTVHTTTLGNCLSMQNISSASPSQAFPRIRSKYKIRRNRWDANSQNAIISADTNELTTPFTLLEVSIHPRGLGKKWAMFEKMRVKKGVCGYVSTREKVLTLDFTRFHKSSTRHFYLPFAHFIPFIKRNSTTIAPLHFAHFWKFSILRPKFSEERFDFSTFQHEISAQFSKFTFHPS